MTPLATDPDPFDVRRVRHAAGLLREFNDAGVLGSADIHVALRLSTLSGEEDESVLLAAALAVRAPRLGHVYVDLATIRDTAAVDTDEPVDLSTLPWPPADAWSDAVASSGLVCVGEEVGDGNRPLRLVGTWLYLDRYWREERRLAADLLTLADHPPQLAAPDSTEAAPPADAPAPDLFTLANQDAAARPSSGPPESVRLDLLREGIERLFPGETGSRQALAAASAVLRRLAVVAGGPGTGKTTTVARIVALLAEQATAAGAVPPLVALAAPTGKGAARLEEAVHEEAAKLDVSDEIRAQLHALEASTLHRLLGWRPDSNSRFRHNRGQRLPHDVVVVDETSMVSLSLMARLVEAIRPDARLILVGDPGQLASIEAGAVLGDIVGPAAEQLHMSAPTRDVLSQATGHEVHAREGKSSVGDGIVVLDRVHRFGGGIADLAEAIRRGDPDAVLEVLSSAPEGVTWIPVDVADPDAQAALQPIRDHAVTAARNVIENARAGNARAAIAALDAFRILCAHRRGPEGVTTWTTRIESWLSTELDDLDPTDRWYPGRPLLVTENDYELRLYNGDTGVVVQSSPDRLTATFDRGGDLLSFSPTRLSAVDTVYAMTIHKSQGSQFDTAAVLLPDPASRILTRELLYTAATRAREQLVLVGTEATICAAVARPVARASGLRPRLWASCRPDR